MTKTITRRGTTYAITGHDDDARFVIVNQDGSTTEADPIFTLAHTLALAELLDTLGIYDIREA